jgi:multidrug efflux pump
MVRKGWVMLFTGLGLVASGCHRSSPPIAAPQLPVVPISKPVQREVTDYVDYTGRTDAVQSVGIRARVTGYIDRVRFQEGAEVQKGDVLFEIDPRPYQAQLDQAALIPLVAAPVAIVGTFAVMAALHYSLNNISLFGLLLAIGIVVDDAIVVVENVERWLAHSLSPREAARKAMVEVTGPVIAVALVLCAVFVPCAFLGGITGHFFRQFAVTISASTVLSAFNSLTLSPALAAILLRPHGARRDPLTRLLDLVGGWFFRLFNAAFRLGTAGYTRAVGGMLPRPGAGAWGLWRPALVLVVYGGLVVLTYAVFRKAPTGFIPEQDQGRLIVNVLLPDSASLQRTQQTVAQIERIAHEIPGVAHTTTVSGMSQVLSANASNFATLFVILDPFAQRRTPDRSSNAIAARLRHVCARQLEDGRVTVFGAPAIPGLSVAGGFQLMVEDRANLGPAALQK